MTKKLMMTRRFIAAGVLSAFMFVGIASVNAQLTDGLVAHFPLDEDGNSTNGEFTASTVTDVEFGSDGATANTGTSATFNGSSSIIQHDWIAGLNPEDSFTLSLWAKSDGGAGAWHSPVTSRNDLNPDSQGYIIYDNEPAGRWTFWSGNGTEDGNWQTMDGPEATMGEWEHLTIVYDSTEGEEMKRLYVNGELALESNDIVAENDTKPFNIGAGQDMGNGFWFKGDIDDIILWSRALSASEVADVHANGISGGGGGGPLVPGLIAYWDFDDASQIIDGTVVDLVAGIEGVVNGGVEAVEGHLGGAVDFGETPGGNWISVDAADNTWLEPASDANALSVSLWQKLHSRVSSSTFWFGATSASNGARNFQAHIPWGGGDIFFDTAGCCGGGDTRINKASDIDYLEWHHFVFIKDEDNKSIWIDGELFHEGENTGTLFDDWTVLGIGSDSAGGSNVAGIVDDFGVWARGITEDEIASIYNAGAGSPLYTEGTKSLIGLNFGADQGGGSLGADDSAGVAGSAQSNWNNLEGAEGSASLVGHDGADTGATVEWASNNLWSSTGAGEENNGFADGGDKTLFTGYLDTTDNTTTSVTIKDIPAALAMGYDVVLYLMGGVPHKGGAYWVEDESGNVLGTNALATFESNFDGDLDTLITLGGTAVHDEGMIKVTEAANSQLGGFRIDDFTDGATFTDFEITFRTFIGLGTDRPADGMSLSIGSGLADAISEEGDPNAALRFCFDTWDNGGGEAPSIDIFNGADLLVAQKFDGVGTDGEERFEKDDGEFLYIWDDEEWADVKIKVAGGYATVEFRGYTVIDREPIEVEPMDGAEFLFGGRTGGANEAHYVDDLKITLLAPAIMIGDAGENLDEYVLDPGVDHDDEGNFVVISGLTADSIVIKASTQDGYGHSAEGQGATRAPLNAIQLVGTASSGGAKPPVLSKLAANAGGFSFLIKDAEGGAEADPDSIVVTYDGAVVEVVKSKADGITSVSYTSPELLVSDSVHTLKVVLKDTTGKNVKLEKEFKVKPYTLIDSSVRVADSLKGDSGFLVYATQISSGQGVGTLHGNQLVNAEKQIAGGYIDPDTEEQYLNEADIDSFEGWSYYPEIVETVNQNQDAPGAVGNFNANNGYEDEPLTGIPGWGDSTDGIASEYIALLDLERGAYKLGVNSDDGFSATIGANFGDLLAQQLGLFNGGRGASDTTFQIFIDEPGLYPYRVSWWEGGGGANIEIFSYVNIDGKDTKVLINDPDVAGSIKAYTIAGAVVDESTAVRATTGRAKVLSVSPAPGDTLVKSSEVSVVIQNEGTTVKQDTVVLSLNGEAVDASVSKDGSLVTISYSPDSLPVGAHTASISFEESNGITRSTEWSFGVPGLYVRSGDVPAEPMGLISIREYTGIGGGALSALYASDKFPDTPDVSTFATYFEWPNTGDIEVPPACCFGDNYGMHAMGYLYPPETGEYIFALACDDNGQLWLSTDEDPANAKLIANQGGWQPVRDYRAETTSAEIFLEAGKVYFIESIVKEAGGGDNLAVAWSMPEDGPTDPEPGALPISGDYLSPFFSVLDGEPSPILTSTGPSGAAVADTASISATFKNRGVAFTGVSVTVNGVPVDHTLATDGGTTSITADPGGVKGMVDVTLSWNGTSKSWSYFGHDALGDGPNPIGFWDFNLDIGNGTTIDSVYGLVGQLRNGAAFTDDSHEGTAMDMTAGGNQHVHVAAGEFLNIASSVNQVTVAFWQKNYSIPSTSSFWAEPGRAMQAHVPWSDGLIYWDTAGGGGGGRIQADATDIGGWGEDMLDTWHHYVFIKNEDAKEIWIDGELLMDGDNTTPLPSDINWLNIGGDAAGNNSIRGVIDDFAVFASALDEDQIMALAEGDRSILPAAPGHPILVSARSGGLPGLASYYVQTVGAVPGPWTFKDDVWVSDGSVAGCGGPYHDFLTSPDYIVSADGEVSLSVDHRHAFEADMWDAGQLWISVNGGAYADVGKDAFSANGYTDKAIVGNGIAKGENGFGGTSAGYADGSYITTTANLGSFTAGDAISVRIVALYDDCATGTKPNWVVAGVSSDQMVASSVAGTANLEVILIKRADALSGEKLSVNGTDVAAEVATDGNTITITGTAADLAPGTAVATVTYNGQSSSWTFTVPERAINNGDGTITYNAHLAWEWWDGIGGHLPEHLNNFINDARYPDSPDGATFAPSWNTRTALAGGFEGNGRDSYGGRMSGILTAPEDGTYRFFVASDDASVLRISTDTDPANAVQVAHEDGCCKNFTLDDGGLSGTVDLVAGNQYYMEAILKEGGGGDWMTVAWRKPSEDIDSVPGGNQEGIPGEYFTGTVKVPALPALSASVSVAAGNSMDPKATVTLNVTDGATTLDTASVVISLGGTALDSTAAEGTWSKSFSSVTQSGKTHSITAGTGAVEAGTEYTVSATFKDSAGETTTHEATFTIAVWETYALGTKAPATAAGSITAREYEGVGGTSIGAMLGHASFPDSPSLEADAGYFEWPQSGDIDVKPEGNVKDNYAVQMIGFLHPPATGDYQFVIAADDNAQLWLSTDENPMNRQLIATEPQWNGVRAFAVGDRRGTVDSGTADERFENLSKFITLEAGKAYYIEALMNEGGGGDNLAVAWTTGDPVANDALPISGEYLSPWIILDSRVDVSQAEDSVVPSSDNHPAGEHAGLAIDNDSSTKYLNFDGANDGPSGLTITTGGGVVTGLGLTSANDAPDRDPATFVLSGSNDGGATFTEIASGDVPAFSARFQRQEVDFDNSTDYTTYELVFPTTAGASTCCMQVAEIELLGTAGAATPEPPALPWSVGLDDDGWPAGDGGGANTTFVQESGVNELPGNPANAEVAQQGDDDYYWAGDYSTVIAGNGDYTPVGLVEANEESAERAFAGVDNDLRYHFNLPESLQPTDQLSISYDAMNLHTGEADSRYGIEVYVNNVQVQSEIVIREAELGQTYATDPFTLADVNAEVGSGYDNIITLKGVNYNAEGGGNWMGIDYVQLSQAGGGGDAPALSVVNNGDGTVTITFEGTLQSADSVNGPWSDVDAPSPLTIPADQAQQYGRAVAE